MQNTLYQNAVRGVWGIYAVTLFVLTHIPLPKDISLLQNNFDKVVHASVYLGLAILTILAFWDWWAAGGRNRVLMLVGLVLYGMVDELLQIPVGRSGDLIDWLADTAGIIVGWIMGVGLLRILGKAPVDDPPVKS